MRRCVPGMWGLRSDVTCRVEGRESSEQLETSNSDAYRLAKCIFRFC